MRDRRHRDLSDGVHLSGGSPRSVACYPYNCNRGASQAIASVAELPRWAPDPGPRKSQSDTHVSLGLRREEDSVATDSEGVTTPVLGPVIDDLISQYVALRPAFEALRDDVDARLAPLNLRADVNVHTISHRLKATGSLRGKLARPDRTYRALPDITDLLGFRVVTYFDDGVEAAARFVEGEFDVDLTHSVDKRGRPALDRFGYRSLHYICRANRSPDDGGQPLRFEVQIRTILQHAWAEIEHDLGYKSTAAVPPSVRRRFSRLAGLLDLADDEFLAIKRDLGRHRSEVKDRVRSRAQEVALDVDSLTALLDDPEIARADAIVAGHLHAAQTTDVFYPEYLVRMLSHVGIERVDQVRAAVKDLGDSLIDIVPAYFAFAGRAFRLNPRLLGPVKRGYGLLFVAHALLARTGELEVELVHSAQRFFTSLDYQDNPDEARRVAIAFVRTIRAPAGAALRG